MDTNHDNAEAFAEAEAEGDQAHNNIRKAWVDIGEHRAVKDHGIRTTFQSIRSLVVLETFDSAKTEIYEEQLALFEQAVRKVVLAASLRPAAAEDDINEFPGLPVIEVRTTRVHPGWPYGTQRLHDALGGGANPGPFLFPPPGWNAKKARNEGQTTGPSAGNSSGQQNQ